MNDAPLGRVAADDRATLFHLAVRDEWEDSAAGETYVPAAFSTDGFIHFSYRWQLAGVRQRYYAGRTDLVLLEVDRDTLVRAVGPGGLREEPSPSSGEYFPHLYGVLPRNVVHAVREHAGDRE